MKTKFVSAFVLASTLISSAASAESVTNGGKILADLISSCDIVGIGSTGGGFRYALRRLSVNDIASFSGNSLTIRNLDEGEKSFSRPSTITLTLNSVTRSALTGEPTYRISGSFVNAPKPDGVLVVGKLKEINFAPSDRIKIDTLTGNYLFRGQMEATWTDLENEFPQQTYTDDQWDLAIPNTFSKEGLCRNRDANRDVIAIN